MVESLVVIAMLLWSPGLDPPAANQAGTPIQPVVCLTIDDPAIGQRADALMTRLQHDLAITPQAAAAIAAHAIAESRIEGVNERFPLVRNSHGGIGYLQWTGEGPGGRRSRFEAYAASHSLDVHSPEASIGFLESELRTRFPLLLETLRTPGLSAASQALAMQLYVFGADPRLNAMGPRRAACAERLATRHHSNQQGA